MPAVGELVRTTSGTWIIKPPLRCEAGHPLGPEQVLVGHVACAGHGGGHTTWTCRACDHTTYGPALNTHCTVIVGATTAGRLSTHSSSS